MEKKIIALMSKVHSASFAHVETLTKVAIPLKWGLGKNVTKYTRKMVQLAYSYESAVNRHRIAEGLANDFVAETLPWGEWLIPNKVITHKGKYYLRAYDYRNNLLDAPTYYVDGRVATEDEVAIIKEWLASKSQTSRQGVENEVKPTNIEFGNIVYLACGSVYEDTTRRILKEVD